MDKDDAIALTLLIVGGGHKEAEIEANGEQNNGDPGKPGDHPSCQMIEGGR